MTTAKDEGALWGAEARDWAELQEPTSIPLWERMLDATGVGEGTSLLDVGCGAGGAELLARERGARIFCVDAAENSVALARDRLPEADIRVGSMEALPFADGSFDAVIAVNSIQFVPDARKGLNELARVCRPGGRVSVAVFGRPDEVDEDVVFNALADLLPPPRPTFKEYRFSSDGQLEEMLAAAGLHSLETDAINTPFVYSDRETGYRAQRSAGSLQEVIDAVGEDGVKQAVFSAFERFTGDDGQIHMDNTMRYVTGTR